MSISVPDSGAALREDRVGHGDLPDVVQQPGEPAPHHGDGREAVGLCDPAGQVAHLLGVEVLVALPDAGRQRQCPGHVHVVREVRVEIVAADRLADQARAVAAAALRLVERRVDPVDQHVRFVAERVPARRRSTA